MKLHELTFSYDVEDDEVLGIVHVADGLARRGVLIVVGGSQYRVGAHRQFVLLARYLAAGGLPVMRFDLCGMGDGAGERAPLIEYHREITAAIDRFQAHCPGLKSVVLWGLCDGASALALNAWRERRVSGVVMLNPWVRTEKSLARAQLKHYYLGRVFDMARWWRLLSGNASLRPVLGRFLSALKRHSSNAGRGQVVPSPDDPGAAEPDRLRERMLEGLGRLARPVLVILSGDDLVAMEFRDMLASERPWRKWQKGAGVTLHEIPEANHIFSSSVWREQVAAWTLEWIRALDG